MLLVELVPSPVNHMDLCGPNGCQANTYCPPLNSAWNAEVYEHLLAIGLKGSWEGSIKVCFYFI